MVTCAAGVPEVAAVITAAEIGGERARFTRHQLDLLGRGDEPVITGQDLGNRKYWVMSGVTPSGVSAQPVDVVGAVRAICAQSAGPVRWLGCGPMTELAAVLRAQPDLVDRLVITQMGGAINYRDPDKAEHNFRLDPDAARYVLAHARYLTLVVSDVTFTDEIALYPGHPILIRLAAPTAPAWAALLAEHFDRWEAATGYTSKMHDPLALTVALGLGFVRVARRPITVGEDGRMRIDHSEGRSVLVSTGANYPHFVAWLSQRLTSWSPAAMSAVPAPAPGE
ncbi:nucleoside hydrolase [Nocardia puris]|uniref:nucleoside hydrolase n=1 Tax=Nocardia puris TaxID=208602 RepID=UPI002E1A585E